MIILNGATAIFDMVKRIYLVNAAVPSVVFVDFCTLGYFISHILVLPLLYLYTLSLIRSWREVHPAMKLLSILPLAAGIGILLTNGFTHLVYAILDDGTYDRQPGIYSIYGLAGFYMILIIYVLIRYNKQYSHQRRLSLLVALGIVAIGIAVQFAFPTLIVETVFGAVCMMIFFFVVQNPRMQIDHSTGMFNRRAFGASMSAYLRSGKEFFLILVVIDNFADVSLQQREKVICMVADYLKSLGRGIVVYRIDSNSLAVMITDKTAVLVEAIAEEIMKRFRKNWQGPGFRVVLKPRVCQLGFPGEISKMDEFRAVFANLKERHLENRIYNENDFELKKIVRESLVSDALIRALEEDRFELNYTPIFSYEDRQLQMAESNLKFLDPELGYVYEDDIEDIAEKSGKMAHLSEWILVQTCQMISENHLDTSGVKRVMVRLSTGLCLQYGYEDIILETIRNNNISPSMICLKVSEYTVSKGADLLFEGMKKLKETGITFCLENYGSGFTNLSSLYELSFDYLEISRNVIRDAEKNEKSQTILEYTLQLAKSLNIKTMVDGVNSEEQSDILNGMSCDFVQGKFYLGQMLRKDFLKLVEDEHKKMIGSDGVVEKSTRMKGLRNSDTKTISLSDVAAAMKNMKLDSDSSKNDIVKSVADKKSNKGGTN